MEQKENRLSNENPFQQTLKWIILGAISIGCSVYFTQIFYVILFEPDHWIVKGMKEQFAVTVSLPFAAMGASFVVLLLQYTAGPIELETLGFKFKGASGPVILWIAVFLAIVAAIKILWIPIST